MVLRTERPKHHLHVYHMLLRNPFGTEQERQYKEKNG